MKIIYERRRLTEQRNLLLFFLISGEVETINDAEKLNIEIARLNNKIFLINNMTLDVAENFNLTKIEVESSL